MQRPEVKDCQKIISDYLTKGNIEVPNGNTPSPISPTNSVGSQVRLFKNKKIYSQNVLIKMSFTEFGIEYSSLFVGATTSTWCISASRKSFQLFS